MQGQLFTAKDYLKMSYPKSSKRIDAIESEAYISQVPPAKNEDKSASPIQELEIEHIEIDPYRFQYKLMHNGKTGSTGSLKGVKVWNPDLAGLLLVWRDPNNGKIYNVHGHNRLDLAKSNGVIKVWCKFIDAPNSKAARLIGAMANIAEGKGTALDAAKILRDGKLTQDDLKNKGICLADKLASQALNISKLPDFLFEKTLTGNLGINESAAIGSLESEKLQIDLYNLINKEKRALTQNVLSELVLIVKSSNGVETNIFSLFGDQEVSTVIEKAELISYVQSRLQKEKALFSSVSKTKNKSILERGNNRIDQLESSRIAHTTDNALILFNQLKLQSGNVSTYLNDAAKHLKHSKSTDKEQIKQSCYELILTFLIQDEILELMA